MKLELTKKEIKKILQAINEIKEYTTEWDELYGKIAEQHDEQLI